MTLYNEMLELYALSSPSTHRLNFMP